jgi:dTMP kinase
MRSAPFIVLEGLDGSGTTSQASALARALAPMPVVVTAQPSTGALGSWIRSCLRTGCADQPDPKTLALAFAADRMDHLCRTIEPALASGSAVVCDRYVLSSWAYQSVSCPLDWVKAINQLARWPDLTFFLDVPPRVAMQRITARNGGKPLEHYETDSTLQAVATNYSAFVRQGLPGLQVIDGTRPLPAITAQIAAACREWISAR